MNGGRTLIKSGRIIDPANQIDQITDLLIVDGKIQAIGNIEPHANDRILDAAHHVVCPGLVDLRANLREPGQEHKATIESEAAAASRGGITCLSCPPDTSPVIDTPAVIDLLKFKAAQTKRIHLHPIAALTQNLNGFQLAELAALRKAGCAGVSNAKNALQNTLIARRAFEYASTFDLTVHVHPEDADLKNNGCVHEGIVSTRLGLPGIPSAAESIALARDLHLARLCAANIHFCGISQTDAVNKIQLSKQRNDNISADVAIHQLFLTEHDVNDFDVFCHVSPPFRTTSDRDALRAAVKQGVIDVICSDHQPHDADAKCGPFAETEPGISGLETLLALTLALVKEQVLDLSPAIACITSNPAQVLGIDNGTLTIGRPADICIFDPEAVWQLEPDNMTSRGRNTPFAGREFVGQVRYTLFGGELVYSNNPDVSIL